MSNTNINQHSPLKAIVLAGGKSSRMGTDKAMLLNSNLYFWEYLADMCAAIGLETHISCRKDQIFHEKSNYPIIFDSYDQIGPMGGILSAFQDCRETAWLVLACDMQGISTKNIEYLISKRDARKDASIIFNQADKAEPLFGIWESSSKQKLLDLYNIEDYSLQKVLEISDICKVQLEDDSLSFININSPQDYQRFQHGK